MTEATTGVLTGWVDSTVGVEVPPPEADRPSGPTSSTAAATAQIPRSAVARDLVNIGLPRGVGVFRI